jgi:hypothetical protein
MQGYEIAFRNLTVSSSTSSSDRQRVPFRTSILGDLFFLDCCALFLGGVPPGICRIWLLAQSCSWVAKFKNLTSSLLIQITDTLSQLMSMMSKINAFSLKMIAGVAIASCMTIAQADGAKALSLNFDPTGTSLDADDPKDIATTVGSSLTFNLSLDTAGVASDDQVSAIDYVGKTHMFLHTLGFC